MQPFFFDEKDRNYCYTIPAIVKIKYHELLYLMTHFYKNRLITHFCNAVILKNDFVNYYRNRNPWLRFFFCTGFILCSH